MEEELKNKLNEINNRTISIENKLNEICESTENMDNHINFVESIYDIVKAPFISLIKFYSNNDNIKILENNVTNKYKKINTI
jgi:archaellum component FlaC